MPYEKIGDNDPVCIADEVPFEIPESWEWARCSSIGRMIRGKGIKRSETLNDGFPCVRYGEIYTTYNTAFSETKSYISKELYESSNLFRRGDIIFTLTGENQVHIAKSVAYFGDTPVAAGGDMAYWTEHGMNPLYLVIFLNCPYCIELKKRTATGDIIVHISTDKIGSFLIPVPPITEQNRIVGKIKELSPLLNTYNTLVSKAEEMSLSFPDLLKKSILQQAIMGKLVPQNPNDEPASELLIKIREEKEALINAGKLKKDKHESVIYRRDNSHYEKRDGQEICIDDEIPFEIPNTWEWSRASSIGSMVRGKGIKRTETVPKGIPCVRYGEIYTSYNVSFSDTISFIEKTLDKNCLHFSTGDIIFTLTGENKVDIAKAVAYLGDEKIAAGGDLAYWTAHGMNPLYLVYYMASPYCIERKRRTATGDIIVHISTDKVGSFLVPVPPLNEQDRIVKAISRAFSKVSAL